MSYDFNIGEILDIAIKLEKNGTLFYKNASLNTINRETKEFLLNLSEMEKKHKRIFLDIKKKLTKYENKNLVFDPNNDNSKYIKALADTEIFFERAIDLSSIKGILKEAILAEKDSIIFYIGIKKYILKNEFKNKIDDIIDEEMKHITKLSNNLKKIR